MGVWLSVLGVAGTEFQWYGDREPLAPRKRGRMVRKACAGLFAACTLGIFAVVPAASAQPVITGGLVNLTITNVLNNNVTTVQIPVTAAAAVCGVQVGVISALGQAVTCTPHSGTATATV